MIKSNKKMEKKNGENNLPNILEKKKEREKKAINSKVSNNDYKDESINFDDVENFSIEFISNPKKIFYFQKMKIDNWVNNNNLTNTFISLKSFDNLLYLIYSDYKFSIIAYNIIDNKKIIEIKNAHYNHISKFKHYLDKINNRDLLISISNWYYNIKLWNINNWECLYNFQDNSYGNYYKYSADFLIYNNEILIIIGRTNIFDTEIITPEDKIRVYDLKGKKIKEIKNSNIVISNIFTYYDNKLNKIFIIGADRKFINSYDYNENKLYYKYSCKDENEDNEEKEEIDNYDPSSIFRINVKEELVELIYLDGFGNINIWNFHSGELLKKIEINKIFIYDILLWNKKYLFLGCSDYTIKLIELDNYKVIKTLIGHNDIVQNLTKIIHPKFGECLLSQGKYNGEILLWFKNCISN